MDWANRGNSREAWDQAFSLGDVWDTNQSDLLTLAFGRVLIERICPEVAQVLCEPEVTVLDWGCARGQITYLLRERFPQAYVAGLDFSGRAVEAATERYGPPFIHEPNGEIFGSWDVIVNSNVLEHMADPIGLVREQLAHTRRYYVFLTPFEEELGPGMGMTVSERVAAGHAHVQRFSWGDFPEEIDGARLIQADLVQPGPVWPGDQLLGVYRLGR